MKNSGNKLRRYCAVSKLVGYSKGANRICGSIKCNLYTTGCLPRSCLKPNLSCRTGLRQVAVKRKDNGVVEYWCLNIDGFDLMTWKDYEKTTEQKKA